MSTTWILVADKARARLFSLDDGERDPAEIEAFANPEGRMPGRELERDRPPRIQGRFGNARHAVEARTSRQEKSASRFAGQLRSVLERGCETRACKHLALIAPPRFLGALNAALGKNLRAHVVLEVAKDLTRADARTIGAELPQSLRRRA